jgi:hypothetical protein
MVINGGVMARGLVQAQTLWRGRTRSRRDQSRAEIMRADAGFCSTKDFHNWMIRTNF